MSSAAKKFINSPEKVVQEMLEARVHFMRIDPYLILQYHTSDNNSIITALNSIDEQL